MNRFTQPFLFRKKFLNSSSCSIRRCGLIVSLLLLTTVAAFAQQPTSLGTVENFKNQLSSSKNHRGAEPHLQTNDADFPAVLNRSTKVNGIETLVGEIRGIHGSHFMFTIIDGKLEGLLLIPALKKAYRFYTDANGNVKVESTDINGLVCIDFSKFQDSTNTSIVAEAVPPATSEVYRLQSLPGATAVAYLDFDGEVSTTSYWNGGNTVNAQPGNFTETDIINIFNLVSEDYRPFRINITTDLAVFNAAPVNRRMRCIFTPNDVAAPGSGGVAYLRSFSWNNDTPCWVFNSGSKAAGEAASHELGHTFGLSHDGRTSPAQDYYSGAGIWAPIMGVGYSRGLVQWSKGEYPNASRTEDDVAIISNSTNGFGYKADEDGGTPATAKALVIGATGTVTGSQNYGIITTRTDVDVYSFTTSGGTVTLTATPASSYANLDILLTLTNASGTVVATANPTAVASGSQSGTNPISGLSASISTTLAAGTYYLQVDGTGQGDLTTGYSDYASLGEYRISGTVPVSTSNQPPVVSITSPAPNTSFAAPASITITANATDDGSVSKVDFYNGTTLLGSDPTSPYSFSWTNVAAGTYTITAIATDNLGLTSNTASVTVNVTNTNQPPVVAITSPGNNANFVAPASISITATASDNESVTKVEFYNGTTFLGSDVTSPYTFTWANVAAGTYTITAKATDNLGSSSSVSVNVNVTTAPASVATVYKDCNFSTSGYAVPLGPGNYTLTQLRALGVANDDISSLRVQSGYEVVLYRDDNFLGNAIIARSDVSCLVNNGFNDLASSLRVRLSTAAAINSNAQPLSKSLSVFPNPADQLVTVTFHNIEQISLTVTVLDNYGNQVGKFDVKNGEQINLSHLPTGIYSLRAIVDQELLITKIIVQ